VSQSVQPSPSEPQEQGAAAGEAEEVDGVPVLPRETGLVRARRLARGGARERSLGRQGGVAIPAVQAAAVAAGGFVAGAAVIGLVHRRQRNSPALAGGGRAARALARGGARKSGGAAELVQIVGSRTLLVDVHLLGIPDTER